MGECDGCRWVGRYGVDVVCRRGFTGGVYVSEGEGFGRGGVERTLKV